MKMCRRLSILSLAATLAAAMVPASYASDGGGRATAQGQSEKRENTMKIRLDVEGTAVTAILADNPTSRDFVSLLPLTLTLEDYAGTEKVSDLPRKLSIEEAPAGADPSIGDIAYYAPWGNLAIFYRDFGYSTGLVILGKIDDGMETLSTPSPLRVTIELLK
ncbi:MAG: hypothetical protein IH614_17190 [Desulfuromonadales bacterium]|nr:hypothetical protein [Desulfuromonadales bacterium]